MCGGVCSIQEAILLQSLLVVSSLISLSPTPPLSMTGSYMVKNNVKILLHGSVPLSKGSTVERQGASIFEVIALEFGSCKPSNIIM
ncbi:hypothetical protein Leryth_023589 [Lithospermum erythrorhizon]|nr:hypothetical protein Leryth_023589 [Lithospermum erythrorhizon]